jgi:hypothetical protein
VAQAHKRSGGSRKAKQNKQQADNHAARRKAKRLASKAAGRAGAKPAKSQTVKVTDWLAGQL